MNRHLAISLAILLFTAAGLGLGTLLLNDAEQKDGLAGFVQMAPVINAAAQNTVLEPECEKQPLTVRCNKERCVLASAPVTTDSCQISQSKYLKDTLLVSAIMLSEGRHSNPDLSWMQMEYYTASSGKEMIAAQHEMIGIYLIERKSASEMLFMNYFERAVQVKFSSESHNGMPDVCATNFDMSLSFYVWDGQGYKLDREERRSCPA